MKKYAFKYKIIALLVTVLLIITGFTACSPIKEISEVAETIMQDVPTADDTLTSLLDINRAMAEAMARGEEELTFNAADIGENELRRIGDNLSTFWGNPIRYTINYEIQDVEGIVPDRKVVVRNITNYFELSSNYYVYNYIVNDIPIPEDKTYATQIANTLPSIAGEIFADPSASDYDKTLAAHDWLVANVDYDATIPGISEQNGSYGAIVLRQTMCQGYAEALELLLKCYTDVEIVQMIGTAQNSGNEAVDSQNTEEPEDAVVDEKTDEPEETIEGDENNEVSSVPSDETPNEWGGHAWNAVKFDGDWYQVDTTFNDPRGNPTGHVSHFYFGQTDEVMQMNHQWNAEYFPVSDTENFLFFRRSGLFAENWEAFEEMFTNMLTEEPITEIEIAIQGAMIDVDNIQFIYKIRREIEEIRWSEQIWNDICVNSIELIYS